MDEPPFIKFQEGRQLAWDASSLAAFRRCPTYYKNLYLREPRLSQDYGPNTTWGNAFHKCRQQAELGRLEGRDAREESLIEAFKWRDQLSTIHFENLLLTLIEYHNAYSPDCLSTLLFKGQPAIEMRFEFPLPFHPSLRAVIRVDNICLWNDEVWIRDYKCTGQDILWNYHQKYTPNTQVSFYLWAARELGIPAQGVIIDAVQIHKDVRLPTLHRYPVTHTLEYLKEWEMNFQLSIAQAELCVRHNHWPKNDASCDNYGGCPFRLPCEQGDL